MDQQAIIVTQQGKLWHVIDTEDDTVLAVCQSQQVANQACQRWLDRVVAK